MTETKKPVKTSLETGRPDPSLDSFFRELRRDQKPPRKTATRGREKPPPARPRKTAARETATPAKNRRQRNRERGHDQRDGVPRFHPEQHQPAPLRCSPASVSRLSRGRCSRAQPAARSARAVFAGPPVASRAHKMPSMALAGSRPRRPCRGQSHIVRPHSQRLSL